MLFLMVCVKAHTHVNLQEGSFNLSSSDFGFLERTYSSRSVFMGYFGFGWCSVLEVRKNKTCDYPTSPFTPSKYRFNEKGDLVSWGKKGTENRVLYKDDRPTEIVTQKLRFRITWDSQRKFITGLQRSPLHIIEYTYDIHNLVKFTGLNPAEMKYDGNHNLTELISSKTALQISYSEMSDTVKELKGTDACSEIYDFQKIDAYGLKTKAQVFEVCGLQKRLKARADFEYFLLERGRYKLRSAKLWKQEQEIKINRRNAGGQ